MKNEESEATKALESVASTVQSAEKILLKAQSSGQSGRGLSRLEQKLSTAGSKMATATKSLQWLSKRRKLISDFRNQTRGYEIASDNASRQSILLRWILQQVPLVELELNPAKVSKSDSVAGNGRGQRSLKRNRPVYPNEEPVLKRQRPTERTTHP
ncbi:hypothetical protein BKA61DRAFT_337748 [Leptodontidium sp. MPI-SDFR-AT-0119]|nr:hypothetical protein BKA61DRAFT_337748 [Leptodontidium sp. MPI-SDFR-AT-0119]